VHGIHIPIFVELISTFHQEMKEGISTGPLQVALEWKTEKL